MPLLPTRQLQFHTSPNFNSLRFFTHTCSSIHKNFIFKTPIINFTYLPFKKPFFHCNTFCTHTWLKRWNQPSSKHTRPKPPRAVLDISSSDDEAIGGSRMDRIVEKLKKFGYESDEVDDRPEEGVIEKGSVEDIFHVEEGMLPNTRGGFSPESPFGVGRFGSGGGEVRFPWEKPVVDEEVQERKGLRKKSKTSMAELTLPESELRRLLKLSFMKKHKTRIGGGGVTQAVVEKIHERWKTSEIVRLKFEGDAALNMKRMHEMLERKTGGLVIWRSGNSVSLYRGVSYKDPSIQHNKQLYRKSENPSKFLPTPSNKSAVRPSEFTSNSETNTSLEKLESTSNQKEKVTLPKVSYEDEVDKLLNDLGPRYTDWAGCEPLPVDADMLPPTVPGYQPPFRVLPFGVRPTLGLKEATSLRRIARGLPPHFALGRNRQLQGLAAAMIKLWEKSSIAKVALKRGVQLTTSERMAEEIKKLTGGIILSRNKDFLVFYRGKNFLSPDVTQALQERERMAKAMQDEEEHARLRASSLILPAIHKSELSAEAGTLGETLDADAKWGKTLDEHHEQKVIREVEQLRHANLVRKLEEKLSLAERKIMRAEKALMKVEVSLKPSENRADPESITDEERFMFRKLGLRMKAFLLMGRRGVFDGTIENMHLHWKYRELVKIIAKASNFEQVKKIALALEAESGGVLVSVDKVSKGYSILVYRGKDYKRPSMLRPKNLLTKRKALARSIELQRHEALSSHILTLQSKVEKLRSEIEQIEKVKDEGDEALYNKLDSAYSTDDDSSEAEDDEEGDEALYNKLDSACSTDDHSSEAEDDEEGDETYLESYNNENESEFENDTINFQPEEFASRS